MKVSIKEITKIFDQLLKKQLNPEFVANWAHVRQGAEDKGELDYIPPNEEKKIWECIIFLLGIDLKDGPDSYLHESNDIIEFRRRLNI